MIGKYNYGTGRRKSSVARVFLKSGKGRPGGSKGNLLFKYDMHQGWESGGAFPQRRRANGFPNSGKIGIDCA